MSSGRLTGGPEDGRTKGNFVGLDDETFEWANPPEGAEMFPAPSNFIVTGQPSQFIKPLPQKHPAWRVYAAFSNLGIRPSDYGLKDMEVFYPNGDRLDRFTNDLIDLFTFIEAARKEGKDIDLESYATDETKSTVSECFRTFMTVDMRHLLENLLITGEAITTIMERVACDAAFLQDYKLYFFDVDVLKDERERLTFILLCTEGEDKQTKRLVKEGGLDYVISSAGLSAERLNTTIVLQNAFCKAYQKMLKYADIEDLDSQEIAQGWGNLMVKMANQIKADKSTVKGDSDIKITLSTVHAPTMSIDELKNT